MADRKIMERTPKSKVTLEDVAKAAGVSIATASRAINGSTRPVQEEFRLKVISAAERLGYRADLAAQAVARGRTRTVALIVDNLRDRYSSAISRGVIAEAAKAGLVVTITGSESTTGDLLTIVTGLRGLRPAAIIIASDLIHLQDGGEDLIAELEGYRRMGGRVSLIGPSDGPFPTTTFNYRDGARQLVTELVEKGYHKPLLLGGERSASAAEVIAGFIDGFEGSGVEIPPERIYMGLNDSDGAATSINSLRDSVLRAADIILCTNDAMAIGVLSALRVRGYLPGEDIGVAGFYDIDGSSDVTPRLSTVSAPLLEAGSAAVLLALSAAAETRVLTCRAIMRESTARGRT